MEVKPTKRGKGEAAFKVGGGTRNQVAILKFTAVRTWKVWFVVAIHRAVLGVSQSPFISPREPQLTSALPPPAKGLGGRECASFILQPLGLTRQRCWQRVSVKKTNLVAMDFLFPPLFPG